MTLAPRLTYVHISVPHANHGIVGTYREIGPFALRSDAENWIEAEIKSFKMSEARAASFRSHCKIILRD